MVFIKSTGLRLLAIVVVFACIMLLLPGLDEGRAIDRASDNTLPTTEATHEQPIIDAQSIILINTPTPTPVPTITPIPTPTPTPFIHPGIRDNKFTNGDVVADEDSYKSENLNVEIKTETIGESVVYIAEIYMRSLDNFIPVFANGKFHGGYKTTSDMDADHQGIFTVNSDSATAAEYGVIIRNQEVYRNVPAAEHLAVYYDGTMKTYKAEKTNAKWLIDNGAAHVFCFGPSLINSKGQAIDDFSFSHIRKRHPRTAVGMIEPFHYIFVVVDGRSSYSKGMTLEQLSKLMHDLKCKVAYNLDGGGSSTMVFQGKRINKPEGGEVERELDSAIVIRD